MSTKSGPMTFQPAPRPQPRVSPELARDLAEATRDLGFGRTTSVPNPEEPVEQPPTVLAPLVTPEPKRGPRNPPKPTKHTEPTIERMASLKVAMPDEIWTALRHEALNRRVTVKYLVMEALADKGYGVDLTKIAEDGRRLR